jgi:hypothetical protein
MLVIAALTGAAVYLLAGLMAFALCRAAGRPIDHRRLHEEQASVVLRANHRPGHQVRLHSRRLRSA